MSEEKKIDPKTNRIVKEAKEKYNAAEYGEKDAVNAAPAMQLFDELARKAVLDEQDTVTIPTSAAIVVAFVLRKNIEELEAKLVGKMVGKVVGDGLLAALLSAAQNESEKSEDGKPDYNIN